MSEKQIPGPNVLLEGPTGTGKTHSIGTLVDAGIEVFYFAFENGSESLRGYWLDAGKPIPSNLHFITVKPAMANWTEMADAVKAVNVMAYDALKKMTDPHRSKYNQLENFLRTFNDVTDDEGKKYGAIDTWGPGRAVVIDGLTGLSTAALSTVVGGKADRDQKDWGLAQNIVENFLRRMCDACPAIFILIAHVERETDPVFGGTKITVSTLGKALPPKIPPMFSDVILAYREGVNFFWSTANSQADLKTRNLPIADKILPDFGQIIGKWKARGGLAK
mgnify:CR=1 FL=1